MQPENLFHVFVEEKSVLICGSLPEESPARVIDFRENEPVELWDIFQNLIQDPNPSHLVLLSHNPSELFRKFSANFEKIEAAGGLVKNSRGKILVIYRHQKWDLPKGKLDPGELPREAAMREVTEESGIGQLHIMKPLPHTLHAYPLENGRWALKKTHWFMMISADNSSPLPQQQEGIEKAEWMGPEQLPMILANTHHSLKELFKGAF